jgi:hypothetical protein
VDLLALGIVSLAAAARDKTQGQKGGGKQLHGRLSS